MGWKAELKGHEFDLATCAEAAAGVGARITKEGDKWFLHSPSFQNLTNSVEVYDEATRLMGSLVAVLSASDESSDPVSVSVVVDDNDKSHHVIKQATGHIRIRSRATGVVGVVSGNPAPQQHETTAAKRARLYSANPKDLLPVGLTSR